MRLPVNEGLQLFQVSTKRIKDFLELPESNNIREDNIDEHLSKSTDVFNDAFVDNAPEDNPMAEDATKDEGDTEDHFSDDENVSSSYQEYVVRFRNAAFSWGMKNDTLLEIDDLDIPAGQCIPTHFYILKFNFAQNLKIKILIKMEIMI